MSPIVIVFWISVGVCAFTWIASLLSGEYSWVDRMWSIAPVAYLWVFAAAAGLSDVRLNIMAVLVTLWGARLTFNFARKGGYSGHEDYRWAVLRGRMAAWQFHLFNLFFIVLYQNLILVLLALPALTAYQNQAPFGVLDMIVAVAFLAFLIAEKVADQQQWEFQQRKKVGGPDYRPRFVQTGLWRFSRHPNFFFEQAQWWALFFFGAVAAGSVVQWSVVGAVLLSTLFIGSTIFTESISRSKYPEYAAYQRSTSPSIPWPPHNPERPESHTG